MCFSYQIDDGPIRNQNVFDNKELPDDLKQACEDGGVMFHAHNAEFEINIWNELCVPRYGWPAMPPERWLCTAAKAAYFSLPRSLKLAGEALGFDAMMKKSMEGNELMKRLATRRVTSEWQDNHDIGQGMLFDVEKYDFSRPSDEDIQALMDYCDQDVVAERAIDDALPEWPQQEIDLWRLTVKINTKGLPINIEDVDRARLVRDECVARLESELRRITARSPYPIKSIGQSEQIRQYLRQHPELADLPNMRKETLEEIDRTKIDGNTLRVLEIRDQIGMTSVSKLDAMLERTMPDGRARNCLMYYGAQATGRFSAKKIQPHNFPRGSHSIDEITEFRQQLVDHGPEYIVSHVDDPVQKISSSLRSFIEAKEGNHLIVSDFGAIEVCVISWLCNEKGDLEALRNGKDPYILQASSAYGVDKDDVTKDQRQLGKVAVLGCGFGMGDTSYVEQCKSYGLTVSVRQARPIVRSYRQTHPAIVGMWKECDAAALAAIKDPGETIMAGEHLAFTYEEKGYMPRLRVDLPSGRAINYLTPVIHNIVAPWTQGFEGVMEFDGREETLDLLAQMGVKFTEPNGRILDKVFVPAKRYNKVTKSDRIKKFQLSPVEPQEIESIRFKGLVANNPNLAWKSVYGALFVQHATQGTARDLLCDAMIRQDRYGFELIANVHDEIVAEEPIGSWSHNLQTFEEIMTTPPTWAPDCPVRVEGFEAVRYAK